MSAGLHLACFPYAGGRETMFKAWRAVMPAGIEVHPIELPGRGRRLREPLATDMAALVMDAVGRVLPLLDRPLALFGHSMGAMLAFEVARWIKAEVGTDVVRLYVSGRRAPHVLETRSVTYSLPEAEFLAEVRRLNGTPAALFEEAELLRLMLPILRADFQVVQTYRYAGPVTLACPIVAFTGAEDLHETPTLVEPWREHTAGPFRQYQLEGDHFFLHGSRDLLLALLTADLQAALHEHDPRRRVEGPAEPLAGHP